MLHSQIKLILEFNTILEVWFEWCVKCFDWEWRLGRVPDKAVGCMREDTHTHTHTRRIRCVGTHTHEHKWPRKTRTHTPKTRTHTHTHIHTQDKHTHAYRQTTNIAKVFREDNQNKAKAKTISIDKNKPKKIDYALCSVCVRVKWRF